MTLLVGILCKDGAVIAADRQVSGANMGMPTRKISILSPNSVFAASGDIAIGQRVRAVLSGQNGTMSAEMYADAVSKLSTKIAAEALLPSYRVHQAMNVPLQNYPTCHSLFASVFKDGIHISCIDQFANFMQLEEHSPFNCLGSGQSNGLSFLTFIWSVFFAENSPSLSEGVFAAYWTVRVAIELQSLGVGLGVDVCVLPSEENKNAEMVSESELRENDELIKEARKALLSVSGRMGGENSLQVIPPLPTYQGKQDK